MFCRSVSVTPTSILQTLRLKFSPSRMQMDKKSSWRGLWGASHAIWRLGGLQFLVSLKLWTISTLQDLGEHIMIGCPIGFAVVVHFALRCSCSLWGKVGKNWNAGILWEKGKLVKLWITQPNVLIWLHYVFWGNSQKLILQAQWYLLQAFPSQAQMTDGSLVGGYWVRGQREGRGTLISPKLEARGIAMIQVLWMKLIQALKLQSVEMEKSK